MDERFLTLYLPDYEQAGRFSRVLDGTKNQTYKLMQQQISVMVGNPQEVTDFRDPCKWIPKLPAGDGRDLAQRIWQESERQVNPRWSRELWRFGEPHALVTVNAGVCSLTDLGKRFVNKDAAAIRQIDEHEGIYWVLSALADKGSSSLNDLLSDFRAFFQLRVSWKPDASFRSALRYRLNNLRHRELVDRKGHKYEITDDGLSYLLNFIGSDDKAALAVQLAVKDRNSQARQQLREFLQTMDPFQFERLIQHLLIEMGYDASDPAPANDKGVDVVAEIELGISRVREAVQVKRHKGNIGSPVLSQLRGSLWQFNAVRGTIFNTGGFSKGAKDSAFVPNVPPITLVNGERLVDLLIEHDIGIRRREIRVLEFDADSLRVFSSEEELEAASIEESKNE